MWFKSDLCCRCAVWPWASCWTSLSFFISVFLLLNGGAILTHSVVWLLEMILLSIPVYFWCSANGSYYDYYYRYEWSRPLRVSVGTRLYRGTHQDEGGRARLDLNSLCVSIKEISLFSSGENSDIFKKGAGSVFLMFWVFQRRLEIDTSYWEITFKNTH